MANEMPSPDAYTGLSRKVLQYSEGFMETINQLKAGAPPEAAWAPIENLVDTTSFRREGVFAGTDAELLDWAHYKENISRYAAHTSWEGTLRHITETPGRVILELEERNSVGGRTHISNTVTIYEFDDQEKLCHLDVYVMPLRWEE